MKKIKINHICLFLLFIWTNSSCAQNNVNDEPAVVTEKSYKTTTEAYTTPGILSAMTYNILWDKTTTGDMQWSYRRLGLIHLLQRHHPDVIGIQEGFLNQLEDINDSLQYQYFGYGTDDGKLNTDNPSRSESMNPIFYNPDRLTLLDKGVFWYSDNHQNIPDKTGYTDTHFRNCVWGKFQEKSVNGQIIYVFNTHFCLYETDRQKQAALLLSKIREIAGETAVTIVTGDFNAIYKSDKGYNLLTDTSNPMRLVNSKDICTSSHIGPTGSGVGIKPVGEGGNNEIDHVFVRNVRSCIKHKTINDYERTYYPSDHLPVLGVLSFGTN